MVGKGVAGIFNRERGGPLAPSPSSFFQDYTNTFWRRAGFVKTFVWVGKRTFPLLLFLLPFPYLLFDFREKKGKVSLSSSSSSSNPIIGWEEEEEGGEEEASLTTKVSTSHAPTHAPLLLPGLLSPPIKIQQKKKGERRRSCDNRSRTA